MRGSRHDQDSAETELKTCRPAEGSACGAGNMCLRLVRPNTRPHDPSVDKPRGVLHLSELMDVLV